MPSKLAINLQRPLGFASYRRLSHRLHKSPLSDKASSRHYQWGRDKMGLSATYFMSPKKGGGQRPVINLKHLNQFVKYEHSKMENIHMLRDLLKKDDYLVKIDLKDAYFTVPVWVNHQKFLRFLWKETLYEYACLPFGLASAPRVFTKIIKPVVGLLHQLGIRIVIHPDDMLIMAQTREMAKCHATTTINLLESLRFTVNYQKSVLIPSTTVEFLGFLVDSKTLTLSLPKEKIKKAKKACQSILDNPLSSIPQLSQLLGYLTSTIQAVFSCTNSFSVFTNRQKQGLEHLPR